MQERIGGRFSNFYESSYIVRTEIVLSAWVGTGLKNLRRDSPFILRKHSK